MTDDEQAKIITELKSSRKHYRAAMVDFNRISQMVTDLEPGNPDGSTALRLANATLKAASDRLNLALNAFRDRLLK
jgi:hypothetical protein